MKPWTKFEETKKRINDILVRHRNTEILQKLQERKSQKEEEQLLPQAKNLAIKELNRYNVDMTRNHEGNVRSEDDTVKNEKH